MRRSFPAAALALVFVAGPAAAGDVKCIWDRLPSAERERFLTQAKDSPPAAVNADAFKEAEVGAAILGCGIKTDAAPAARAALTGFAIDAAIGEWAEAHEKISTDKLESGWDVLSQEQRTALTVIANGGPGRPDPDSFMAFTDAVGVGDRTDLMSGELGQYLFMYMMGRALRAGAEPKF